VDIKCQLDATDELLLQISVLAQHVSGTIMPIIRSSRVLYKWLLPALRSAIKVHLLHLVGILFPHKFFYIYEVKINNSGRQKKQIIMFVYVRH
jgi:hypothetical protein